MASIRDILRMKESDNSDNNTNEKYKSNDLLSNDINPNVVMDHTEISKTYKLVSKYGFSKKVIEKTKTFNLKFKEKFQLSNLEYLMMSIFIVNSVAMMQAYNPSKILKIINGRVSLLPSIYLCLFSLYRKKLLFIRPQDCDVGFCLSRHAKAFFFGLELDEPASTLKEIIRNIDIIANLYNNQQPFCDIGEENILEILSNNTQYEYCKVLLDLFDECKNDYDSICNDQYKFAFYCLGHYILNGQSINRSDDVLELFYMNNSDRENILNTVFNSDNNYLFKNKILERGIDESGKADKDALEIHSDFKRKYLQGIYKEKRHEDVISPEKIADENLFFNKDNQRSFDEFISMLMPENFSKIKERLKKSGTRLGFASIFYGEPGCGKTSGVYKIAKTTGREIIKVDMSSLRSKWWGEDEKNVKGIFSHYKSVLQDSKLEPILLLNEADAIIGKRLDVTGTNGAILTSINATQNIILDELETFEGILIATTNLTQNMDSAFERRFLHKIKFEKPDVENKSKIWKSLLKISEEDALILAHKYDFSGGNIENISRKQIVNNILYGEEYNINTIMKFCDEENLLNKSKPIGFGS